MDFKSTATQLISRRPRNLRLHQHTLISLRLADEAIRPRKLPKTILPHFSERGNFILQFCETFRAAPKFSGDLWKCLGTLTDRWKIPKTTGQRRTAGDLRKRRVTGLLDRGVIKRGFVNTLENFHSENISRNCVTPPSPSNPPAASF